MDLNLLVAAGLFTLVAILVVRYAIRIACLFSLAALVMFLMAFSELDFLSVEVTEKPSESMNGEATAPPAPAPVQPAAAGEAAAAPASAIQERRNAFTPPARMPDAVRFGVPPRRVDLRR